MKNDEIYVIGHKKPDSDSIVSAIAYAYLLNQCGKKAVAGRLGDINEETAYLLDRFGYEEPVLIEDARVRLSEIELKQADHILPGYTHNIINLSDTQDLVTVMWANESFDPEHPDTFFEKV